MRVAQGRADSAAAAMRRIVAETTLPLRRAGLLPAYVEIMLAVASFDLAREACRELDEIAKDLESEALEAMAAHCRGAMLLAEGRAKDALIDLRRAQAIWKELDAPYEIARVRMLVRLACRALEDHDTAALELEAARSAFDHLGATPDQIRASSLIGPVAAQTSRQADAYSLTDRELQVLRLVASGKTNHEIADELFISDHTVARHVQNLFAKLNVSSRAAATAFAFSHQLV